MALQSGQSSLFSDRSSRCEFDHQLQSISYSQSATVNVKIEGGWSDK